MNVLLPTDFSDGSKNAIRIALHLLEPIASSFILLNTYQSPQAGANLVVSLNSLLKEASNDALEQLQETLVMEFPYAKDLFKRAGVYGSVAYGIEQTMEDYDVDLVAMGTKGETGLRKLILGSNTAYAIKYLDIPILAIPSDCVWQKPDNILLAMGNDDMGGSTLNPLKQIQAAWNSKIRVVHVQESDDRSQETSISELQGLPVTMVSKTHPDVIACIEAEIEQESINMTAVIRKPHGLLHYILHHSITQGLATRSNVPLLVLRG